MQYPQMSFTSGVLDPALHARVDSKVYAQGLKTGTNAIVLPQGGVWNRPGTKYIGDITRSASTDVCVCIPFVYSVDQSYLLVFVDQRMYVIKNGGLVQSGGVDYYLSMPPPDGLIADWLGNIRYAQIADELYITSNSFQPKRITRVADDNWTYGSVPFGEARLASGLLPIDHHSQCRIAAKWLYASGTYDNTFNPAQAGVEIQYRVNVVYNGVEYAYATSATTTPTPAIYPLDFEGDTAKVALYWSFMDKGNGLTTWAVSSYGSNWYYLATNLNANMGTLSAEPDNMLEISTPATYTAPPVWSYMQKYSSVSSGLPVGGAWAWDDKDSLGYDTIYINTGAAVSPNVLDDIYLAFYNDYTYRVYASVGQTESFGLIAETNFPYIEYTADFTPQYSILPYTDDLPIVTATSTTWPLSVCFHLQRCWYGGATGTPNQINASRIGNLDGFGYHTPIQDDDAIEATIGTTDVNTIQHLVPRDDGVLVFTDGDCQLMYAAGGVMAPTTISFQKQFKTTVAKVPPLFIGERLIYCDRLGRVREIAGSSSGRYEPIDRSLHAQHLLRGYTIVSWCYQSAPEHTLWAVRSDGALLSCVIVPELETWAWNLHQLGGTGVQCVAIGCIKEGARDKVYVCVKRTINGASKVYVEQLQDRYISTINDAWFLDSALGYTGGGISNPSGLDHLEGQTVNALADNVVITGLTVTSGAVALGATYSDVVVGLPYTTSIETLDVNAPDGSLYGVYHNVFRVRVKIRDSQAFKAGPNVDNLYIISIPAYNYTNATTKLSTGVLEITVDGQWGRNGGTLFYNDRPIPMTIDAVIPVFDVGE